MSNLHANHANHANHGNHAGHGGRTRAPSHGPHGHAGDREESAVPAGLNRVALSATLHCLTGCAIGEVAGLVIGTALGWGNLETIALAVFLAYLSGFGLTSLPLLKSGMPVRSALRVALAADTVSITLMEFVDNLVMLVIPGAMGAGLDSPRFWLSMIPALALAGVAAYPVNRWLIARGRGHAVAHAHHHH